MQYIVVKKLKKVEIFLSWMHGIYRKHQENGGIPGGGDQVSFTFG